MKTLNREKEGKRLMRFRNQWNHLSLNLKYLNFKKAVGRLKKIRSLWNETSLADKRSRRKSRGTKIKGRVRRRRRGRGGLTNV